jgi:hypothetical protein
MDKEKDTDGYKHGDNENPKTGYDTKTDLKLCPIWVSVRVKGKIAAVIIVGAIRLILR